MKELLKNILTSPFWTISATIILWTLLYQLFYNILKLSDKNWKRLEYIWIFTGFIGFMTLIDENKKAFVERQIQFTKQDIELDVANLNNYLLRNERSCFKYTRSNFSPDDLELRQFDQDRVCEWSKKYKIKIDTLLNIPITHLDTLSLQSIPFRTTMMNDYVNDFTMYAKRINGNIDKYKDYSADLNSRTWEIFSKTFGVLLLILAFAIRLSITTKNVVDSKKI